MQFHPLPPTPRALCFQNESKMAASSDKSSEEKKIEGILSQLVARYNYCVMEHPILTKSVTR